nr:MAG TPA: hypothetical protein [Caudoviricetes sp.]
MNQNDPDFLKNPGLRQSRADPSHFSTKIDPG